MTIEELLADYDFAEAFGEGSGGNTDKTVEAFGGVSDAPFSRSDVHEIIGTERQEGDYAETEVWGAFVLKDGRFAGVNASCDTTGWDCQANNTMTVASSLEELMKVAFDDNGRERLREQAEEWLRFVT